MYAPNLQKDGQRWLMWYGSQGVDGRDRIHLTESDDGIGFKKLGVVIDCATANHLNDPSVVRVGDSWWMFYTGAQTSEEDQTAAAVSDVTTRRLAGGKRRWLEVGSSRDTGQIEWRCLRPLWSSDTIVLLEVK